MEAFKTYLLQNWILVLILAAFAIILATTAFVDKKTTRRFYVLIGSVFALSVLVFIEFYYGSDPQYVTLRTVLMSIRYSATPFIVALVIFALVKRQRWFVFIPAVLLLVINIISIFTGIVFKIDSSNTLIRGPLGYFPFIIAGLYCAFLIFILVKRSNKRSFEIIPIVFLSAALISGVIFPFVFGSDFSQIFCTTIAVALFIYYVFLIVQLTKMDALTGVLNRQAYEIETTKFGKDITAVISIDMNGLKKINDTQGHLAGDEALVTLALCFARACRVRESVYRMGGDEFVIVCRKVNEEEVIKLIERIKHFVSATKYTCSIGYAYSEEGFDNLEQSLKESDEKMYKEKSEFYKNS